MSTAFAEITDCASAFHGGPRPIWNTSVYQDLRQKYVQVVGAENATVDLTNEANTFVPPWEVKQTPGKGRGLFAASDIQKGDPLWDASSHAVFREERFFRQFLDLIGYDLACDVLQWAYVEPCDDSNSDDDSDSDDDEDCFAVGVELGEGSFMNTISKGERPNVGFCGVGEEGIILEALIGCDEDKDGDMTYAVRDVQKGEEIVSDYTQFDNDGVLMWFDRLNELAWDDGEDEDDSNSSSSSDDQEEEEEEDYPATIEGGLDGNSLSSPGSRYTTTTA